MARKLFAVAALASLFALHAVPVGAEKFVSYSEARPQFESTAPAGPEAGSIPPEGLAGLRDDPAVIVFDARAKSEFDHEHIAGARLPHEEEYYRNLELHRQQIVREAPDSNASLERATRDIPRGAPIVTYCNRHCGISKALKAQLENLGFTNVRWLDGGIDVWREKGYPVEKP